MGMRRSEMDADIAATATPWQPQVRLLGAILIACSLGVLGLLSIFFSVIPDQAQAAIVTLALGGVAGGLALGMGLLIFNPSPWSPYETGLIFIAIILGAALCFVAEWIIALIFPFLVPLFSYSAVGAIGYFISIAVVPFEELLCAFFQTLFTRIGGPIPGISGRAGIFGILHFGAYALGPGFWAMISVGVITGVAYYKVPYLEVPILIHLLLNIAAVLPSCWIIGILMSAVLLVVV